jgi:CubicO group peptidase (beta-lactamase class C family)
MPGIGLGRPAASALTVALVLALASAARAQQATPSIEERVDAFVAQLDLKRKEAGTVGAAIVVAQGDRVVRIAAFGQRSVDAPAPVTEDTVFAIGSVTKMFTAVAVALAVGEGRMAFEDHPRRFVPEFRLRDPEADAKLNLIDLLAHRSGLERADAVYLYAPFTQAELFALAGRAEPVAKLRERHIYNNTMFSLAGAALARAHGTSYERHMATRIFAPLGLRSTTLTRAALLASANGALGHEGTAGAVRAMTPADLSAIAPAGAINSTARDLGQWLRFLNARGQSASLAVAPAAFARLFERHSPNGGYGLGFYLETRAGVLYADHPGNVPGYTAAVALVPDKALSMALLTNQNNSPLAAAAKELFWELIVKPELPPAPAPPPRADPPPRPTAGPPIAAERLLGHYFSSDDLALELRQADGGLAMLIPGAPPLPLKPLGANLYELVGSGGFALSVFEAEAMPGRIAGALKKPPSQPGGDIPLLKRDGAWLGRARAAQRGPHAALIGAYRSRDRKLTMEIVPQGDGVALNVVGEPLRQLVEAAADAFRLDGRPETLRLRRSAAAVAGFALEQPGTVQEMVADGDAPAGDPARGREILERAVAALGGSAALDRIGSLTIVRRASASAIGLEGVAEDRIVPGKRVQHVALGAFGKVLTTRGWINENGGASVWIDGKRYALEGRAFAAQRFQAVPHTLYRWKERFADVAAAGETVVNGENAYVVQVTPPGLAPSKLYISAASHLILREEHPAYVGDQVYEGMSAVDYSDYRVVAGVRMPFAAASVFPMLGRVTFAAERIALDAPIDPKAFEEP